MRTIEPTIITTREQVEWTKSYADYPATLWNLEYRFRGPGPGFDVDGVADGDDFAITVLGTTTDNMVAGTYTWQAWVTEIADTANKIKVDEGSVMVKLGFDPNSVAAVETRSAAKIMLDTIDAALLAFATSDVLEYEITTPAGSRRVKRSDKAELTSLRDRYVKIVRRENLRDRLARGGSLMTSAKVRFSEQ